MIELVELEKAYRGRTVLSGATLTIQAGEGVALVGANGSGKTTTLRCAVGLAKPDSGRVTIDGVDLVAEPRRARSRMSYLAQRTDFPSTLTVREILQVVADLRGADARAVDREIALCGLSRVAGRTAGTLSGGERQRVAMAALLVPDVAVYLLDEPTLNLDPVGTRLLVDRLRTLRNQGRSVLFTTHVNGELEGLATRVAVLREGRIVPVTDSAGAAERHVSLAVQGDAAAWTGIALDAGATRAWAADGKLHALVGDDALSVVLAKLDAAGVRISAFRTETALASALDRLNDEDQIVEIPPDDGIDRRPAPHGVWRYARWAGAGSAGPR
jgi:ABC-type multidrug transport system ATPase subunit